MNYLAHFYLSGLDDEVLYGNFIGDAIKGRKWENYPDKIKKGILLHRFIDDFIDKHPFAQRSRKRLRYAFGITSAVVLDVYFDHFLTKSWMDYHVMELDAFSETVFDRLRPFNSQMPGFYPTMIEKMEEEKWIESYKSISGTAFVLERMSRRVSFENKWEMAEEVLKNNYEGLQNDFALFFPEIIKSVESNFNIKLFISQ